MNLTSEAFGEVVQLPLVVICALLQQVEQTLLLILVFTIVGVNLALGFVQPAFDAFSFGFNDLFQAFFEVIYHRVHVVLLELLAALVL